MCVWGEISLAHITTGQTSDGASSPMVTCHQGQLLCCPGVVQGPLSTVLQLVKDRTSSSAFMALGQVSHLLQVRSGEVVTPLSTVGRHCRANSPMLTSSGPAHLQLLQ